MKQLSLNSILTGVLALIFAAMLTASDAHAQDSATTVLQPDIEKLSAILGDELLKGDEHQTERREKVMEIIENRFSFRLMSQAILGKGWRKLTDAQKDEFTQLMTELLEHTYIGRLEEYSGGEFTFLEEKEGSRGTARVTTVIKFNGEDVFVYYSMAQIDDVWQVYDVKIETFSLIAHYSEQFQPVFRKEGYEGLVAGIQDLINELKTTPGNE